jgi:hypothetical protein
MAVHQITDAANALRNAITCALTKENERLSKFKTDAILVPAKD